MLTCRVWHPVLLRRFNGSGRAGTRLRGSPPLDSLSLQNVASFIKITMGGCAKNGRKLVLPLIYKYCVRSCYCGRCSITPIASCLVRAPFPRPHITECPMYISDTRQCQGKGLLDRAERCREQKLESPGFVIPTSEFFVFVFFFFSTGLLCTF